MVQFGIRNARIEILTLVMIVGFGILAVGIIHLDYIIFNGQLIIAYRFLDKVSSLQLCISKSENTVFSLLSRFLIVAYVMKPFLAKIREVSYPIPLELPVTRATFLWLGFVEEKEEEETIYISADDSYTMLLK